MGRSSFARIVYSSLQKSTVSLAGKVLSNMDTENKKEHVLKKSASSGASEVASTSEQKAQKQPIMSSCSSFVQRLTRRKVLDAKVESKLDRCLTTFDLTALGIGSTLGVGIYVLAGAVAKDTAGPSVVLSFFIAGVASALSGLCYAELGARVPRAGSAYVYSYTLVGELIAFIIGWNLILEYAIGVAGVARGYSGYLDSILNKTMQNAFESAMPIHVSFLSPYPDLCALCITLLLTVILSIGVKESTRFNNVFTCLNLAVVMFVTVLGLANADFDNWGLGGEVLAAAGKEGKHVGEGGFFPFGVSGTLSGAATCFFGYVGFDSIATSGEETKNPQRSIPIAICASLFCIFLAYCGVSSALTLMVPYYLQDSMAPLPFAFHQVGWNFAGWVVSIGALFGLSTSLLGAMFPLPRVLYAMATDGLIPRFLAAVHPKTQTPLVATVISGVFAGLMATFFDLKNLVDMMSIGTLMAYTIVGACIILLRYQDLDSAQAHEYMALSTTAPKQFLLEGSEPESDEEELVYCRTTEDEDLNLIKPRSYTDDIEISGMRDLAHALVNSSKLTAPTPTSSAISVWLTATFTLLALTLAILLQSAPIVVPLCVVLLLVLMACLLCLMRQPSLPGKESFRMPWVPLLPGLSIFVNLYLMCKLSMGTWVRFAVWMALGMAVYVGYGWRNSSEEYRRKGKKAPEEN